MKDKRQIAIELDEIQKYDPKSYEEIINIISYAKKIKNLKEGNFNFLKGDNE